MNGPQMAGEQERPASLHAEMTIIGAMLVEPTAINEAMLLLQMDDFALDSHRRIYSAITYLNEDGQPVDIITVSNELRKLKELDSIGGIPYLASLSEGLPRKLNIESYVHIVKDKSLLRQLMSACDLGTVEASDQSIPALDVIAKQYALLDEISKRGVVGGFTSFEKAITDNYDNIDVFLEGKNTEGCIATGYQFDKMTNKLKAGELIIIAARPAMGKTAWALNIASNVSVRGGKSVGIISLEMSKDALIRRMLISETRIPKSRFESMSLTRDEKQRVYECLDRLMRAPLYIEDTAFQTMQEIRAKARRLKQDKGLDLLVIDYLGLIETAGKSENRNQEVSVISRTLKGLAKELGIPVIALAQLNRKCEERQDKRPMLSDLRDSGSIEQDADIVAFIYRQEVYEPDNFDARGKAEINLAKQREGPTGVMHMKYHKDIVHFDDAALEDHYAA